MWLPQSSPGMCWRDLGIHGHLHIFIFMSGILLAASRKGKGPAASCPWSALGEEGAACPLQVPAPSFHSWEPAQEPPCTSPALAGAHPSICCHPTEIPCGNAGQLWGCSSQDGPHSLPREAPGLFCFFFFGGRFPAAARFRGDKAGEAWTRPKRAGRRDGNLRRSDILQPFPKLSGFSQT